MVSTDDDQQYSIEDADIPSVRKLDFYLLPFLSLMYFFNSVDRVSWFNATMHSAGQ